MIDILNNIALFLGMVLGYLVIGAFCMLVLGIIVFQSVKIYDELRGRRKPKKSPFGPVQKWGVMTPNEVRDLAFLDPELPLEDSFFDVEKSEPEYRTFTMDDLDQLSSTPGGRRYYHLLEQLPSHRWNSDYRTVSALNSELDQIGFPK